MIATLDQLAKGQIGNVKRVLDTVCDERDRPIRKMDFDHTPTMMEMCIRYGKPFIDVLNHNKMMKNIHFTAKKGYWLGRNRFKNRYTAEIPVQIHGNPRNPLYWEYFHPDCIDRYERRKHLYAFLRKHDMAFSPIEKL